MPAAAAAAKKEKTYLGFCIANMWEAYQMSCSTMFLLAIQAEGACYKEIILSKLLGMYMHQNLKPVF